jgi:hypothetical protein
MPGRGPHPEDKALCSFSHELFLLRLLDPEDEVIMIFQNDGHWKLHITTFNSNNTVFNIPEHFNLQQYCYENLKSCKCPSFNVVNFPHHK